MFGLFLETSSIFSKTSVSFAIFVSSSPSNNRIFLLSGPFLETKSSICSEGLLDFNFIMDDVLFHSEI